MKANYAKSFHPLSICANGDVVPCAKYRYKIDSIYDSNIEFIWNKSITLKSIQNYKWKHAVNCKNCSIKNMCVRCGVMTTIKGYSFLDICKETCKLARLRSSKSYKKYEQIL